MKHILALVTCAAFFGQSSHAADPKLDTCCAIKPVTTSPAGVAKIWGQENRFWNNGSTLRVKFLSGSASQKREAWKRFQEVDALVGLSFVQTTGVSDIRVRLDLNNGHWSYVGTGARSIASSAATMNLGLSAGMFGDSANEWNRVAIHEILHALGFEHEHQSLKGNIPWNRPAVYQYYASTQGWSKSQIDYQVLNRYTGSRFRGTAFDPTSIMQYPVPATLTTNGFSVGWNAKLSVTDITFLKQVYPPPQ